MNNPPSSLFEKAFLAHQAGDLAQAKILYEKVLEIESQHADAMHLLGVLAAQLGQLDTSAAWIEQAIAVNPNVAVFHNNLANALKGLARSQEAERHYKIALQLNPDYAEAHNNLANLLYKQNHLPAALQHYIKAIHLQPDYVEAHLNLGLVFLKQNELTSAIKQFKNAITLQPNLLTAHWQLANLYLQNDDLANAIEHYQTVLHLAPEHTEALNNLGVAFLKQNKLTEAENYFNKALQVEPKHKDARSNLATVLLQQDRFADAVWQYQLFLQLAPEDSDAHYNIGVALMSAGQLEEAIQHFQQALRFKSNYVDAHCNLGAIYLKLDKRKLAIEHYQKALALQPANESISYMLNALTGKTTPAIAPSEYVKNLFDNYAGYFDKHLTTTLHYQTPKLLRDLLNHVVLTKNLQWKILDLGCGTGLSGAAFRDIAKHLVGIDLSPRMLAKAEEKNIYNELIEADIIDALQEQNLQYNLVLSIDTLVYFGDLTSVFANVKKVLTTEGLFAFSVESGKHKDYELTPSGRYTHHSTYIEKLAHQFGFTVLTHKSIDGREQEGKPVAEHLFILKKYLNKHPSKN